LSLAAAGSANITLKSMSRCSWGSVIPIASGATAPSTVCTCPARDRAAPLIAITVRRNARPVNGAPVRPTYCSRNDAPPIRPAVKKRGTKSPAGRGRGAADPIERLREICLALPGTTEKLAWGEPTFRVGGKLFAQVDNHHHGAEHLGVWLAMPLGAQEGLVYAKPNRFFVP